MNAGAELISSGISIRDRFISDAEVQALRECAQARESRGDFAAARIGGQGAQQRRESIRGDFICWLREPLLPMEQVLLQRMEELRLQLNREAFLGLFELELHYAKYPPGSAYARHVDQPLGNTQRKVSLALYLIRSGNARMAACCESTVRRTDSSTSSRSAAGWFAS